MVINIIELINLIIHILAIMLGIIEIWDIEYQIVFVEAVFFITVVIVVWIYEKCKEKQERETTLFNISGKVYGDVYVTVINNNK